MKVRQAALEALKVDRIDWHTMYWDEEDGRRDET